MIPVRNLYYMLAYGWQALLEKEYRSLGEEKFANASDMLAAILCRSTAHQIKRGLVRQYVTKEEPLSMPRGKLKIGQSIKTKSIRKRQLVCTYDEFSTDVYLNRIIKTTMLCLLRSDIPRPRKKELRRLLIFFADVTELDTHRINWKLNYDRNNQTYRMIVAVCRLAIKGLLQTQSGATRMTDFTEKTLPKLYERFIFGYFRREHPDLITRAPKIDWQVTDGYKYLLPDMQTDIVISSPAANKTLIIDAKYYSTNLQRRGEDMPLKLHSANLYQIFAYVKNYVPLAGETVGGMLLYAQTDAQLQPSATYQISGNEIRVDNLPLGSDFAEIAAALDAIADSVRS